MTVKPHTGTCSLRNRIKEGNTHEATALVGVVKENRNQDVWRKKPQK